MTLVPLTGGAYSAKSIIANAQRCVNLYPEINPKDSPTPFTHYPTPGSVFLKNDPLNMLPWRCTYQASNNNIYGVIGQKVYLITGSVSLGYTLSVIGTLATNTGAIVYMADNGIVAILVDGSTNGWAINLSDNNFAQILDPTFVGADRVDYLDTFFILNVTATNEWYISLSEVSFLMLTGVAGSILTGEISVAGTAYDNGTYLAQALTGGTGTGATANITVAGNLVISTTIVNPGIGYVIGDQLSASIPSGSGYVYIVDSIGGTAFDPLDFATKAGYPDPIQTLAVMHLEIWLIGTQTTEVWYNAGAADFTFQILPGVFIEHGCAAKYSLAKQDLSLYWVSQDKQGQCIVLKGNNYAAHRISTFAIEQEFSSYTTISDAIGYTYQQEGHVFYILVFPTANKTWVWDESTELWHERSSTKNGTLNRIPFNCVCNDSGVILAGGVDGNLYQLSTNAFTDNGNPIPRIRSFPHLLNNQKRVIYTQFVADMEAGTDNGAATGDGTSKADPPVVSLRYSDDRGKTYSSYIQQSIGAVGQYLTSLQWRRLGMARDRVFELSWSVPTKTALNGAWVEAQQAET